MCFSGDVAAEDTRDLGTTVAAAETQAPDVNTQTEDGVELGDVEPFRYVDLHHVQGDQIVCEGGSRMHGPSIAHSYFVNQ